MTEIKRTRVLYVARGRSRGGDTPSHLTLQRTITESFDRDGMPSLEWDVVTNQKTALRLARQDPPHLVLVETDTSGNRLRMCEMLRRRLTSVRIVGVGKQVPAGRFVFDAFLHLPLKPDAIEHLEMLLLTKNDDHLLELGPIRLNLDTRTVITSKGQYHMTPKQCALLQYFMIHHNDVIPRSHIMQAIWETNYLEDTRTLDVHIRWLRERIELDPSSPTLLMTVRGHGYRLCLE